MVIQKHESQSSGNSSKEVIKTPQELIHIKHTINLRQYKYWLLMLKTYKDGVDKSGEGVEQINITTLEEWIGYDLMRKELENDLIQLRKETVAFNLMSKNGKKPVFRVDGFINNATIEEGVIKFSLGDWLKETIHSLADYSAIFNNLNWTIFNSFSGKYEAILYKLCRDYSGIGVTKKMTLKEYREYMGLKDTEYPEFKELNRYIISAPVNKINDSDIADISVSPEFFKEGRAVVAVQFHIKMKTGASIVDYSAFSKAIVPIDPNKKKKYLAEFSPKQIELSIERANEYARAQEKVGKAVKNMSSLYNKAITDNWGLEYAEQKELDLRKTAEKVEKAKKENLLKIQNKLIKEKDRELVGKQNDELWAEFMSLTEEQQQIFIDTHFHSNIMILKMSKQNGFSHKVVKMAILGILKSQATT